MEISKKGIYLILVGDGDKEIKDKARELDNVALAGYLNQKDTKKIIKSSKLTVITSEREGFSYVFAESLLLKTPLISTDVADIKKFIKKEYIISSLNPKNINIKIEQIKKEYDLTLQNFTNSFDIAREEFSIEKMIEKYIKLYKRILY